MEQGTGSRKTVLRSTFKQDVPDEASSHGTHVRRSNWTRRRAIRFPILSFQRPRRPLLQTNPFTSTTLKFTNSPATQARKGVELIRASEQRASDAMRPLSNPACFQHSIPHCTSRTYPITLAILINSSSIQTSLSS